MAPKIWIINKAINNDKICGLLKLFWEPGPQRYLRRSLQKGTPAAVSESWVSLALVSVKSVPRCTPQSSLWVTPCISSSQLINSAAGWHHTLFLWPHSLHQALGESRGADAVALFYFWHTPGVLSWPTHAGDFSHPGAKAISAIPGKGQERRPATQTWQLPPFWPPKSKHGGI